MTVFYFSVRFSQAEIIIYIVKIWLCLTHTVNFTAKALFGCKHKHAQSLKIREEVEASQERRDKFKGKWGKTAKLRGRSHGGQERLRKPVAGQNAGGGVKRFLREEERGEHGGRSQTSNKWLYWTPPHLASPYSPPQGMGTSEQQAGIVCVCVFMCIYIYVRTCVCVRVRAFAPCLFQHIVPSNTKRWLVGFSVGWTACL